MLATSTDLTEAERFQLKLAFDRSYTEVICSQPFFASMLLHLQRVEDWSCETMWTDGTRLGYNPRFVLGLPADELRGVLAHEVVHVASLHPWRRRSRMPKPWNIACDQVVNAIVIEAGFTLPAGALAPVPDRSAEELYHDSPEEDGGEGAGDAEGTGGEGEGGGDGDSDLDDPGRCGEVRDATSEDGRTLTEAGRERAMQEARVRVQQAATAAKLRGTLPAGLARLVEEALDPHVPWRELLSRFIDGSTKHDLSWSHLNRRYLAQGLIVPGSWSPGFADVLFAADTSGSVSDDDLKQVCSEILACLELYRERGEDVEVTILWCDAQVYAQTISCWDDALRPKGRGGTSFAPVFAHIEDRGLSPRAVVFATDGHCDNFGPPPLYPVLWMLTSDHNHNFAPPFGEVAHIMHA